MKLHKQNTGFTLVEIMIVVAIIALLAAIAVPNFLRARERGQATTVLNDARLLDAAVDQYAIEQNKLGTDIANWGLVSSFLKTNSRLVADGGDDIFGNPYTIGGTVADGAKVNVTTKGGFNATVVPATFWAGY